MHTSRSKLGKEVIILAEKSRMIEGGDNKIKKRSEDRL